MSMVLTTTLYIVCVIATYCANCENRPQTKSEATINQARKTFHKNITAQGRVKKSQELRMLSSVTINCQVTKMS